MESGADRYLEWLESRLMAWRLLAQALQQGCAALVEMDLAGLYRHISRQQELCAKISILTKEQSAWGRRDSQHFGLLLPGSSPPTFVEFSGTVVAERARVLDRELVGAQEQVRRQNRVQKALLARSSHTVNLRANALVNCFPTYPPPQPGSACAGP